MTLFSVPSVTHCVEVCAGRVVSSQRRRLRLEPWVALVNAIDGVLQVFIRLAAFPSTRSELVVIEIAVRHEKLDLGFNFCMSRLQVSLMGIPAIAPRRLFSTPLLCESEQIAVRSSLFLFLASFLCTLDTLIVRQVELDLVDECVAIDLSALPAPAPETRTPLPSFGTGEAWLTVSRSEKRATGSPSALTLFDQAAA